MKPKDIAVFINQEPEQVRRSLLLAPEVAEKFGWSHGHVISATEAVHAVLENALHTFRECMDAAQEALQHVSKESEKE